MALTNHLYEYGNADLLAQVMHLRKEVNERDVFIAHTINLVKVDLEKTDEAQELSELAPAPKRYEVS